MSKNTIVVVACPDWGAGNDPEALGLAIHQVPIFSNAYCKVEKKPGLSRLSQPRRSALYVFCLVYFCANHSSCMLCPKYLISPVAWDILQCMKLI